MKFWKAMSSFTDGMLYWMWTAGESMKIAADGFIAQNRWNREVNERFALHLKLAAAENQLKDTLVEITERDNTLKGTEFENVNRNFWFKDHLSKLAERVQNREKGLE